MLGGVPVFLLPNPSGRNAHYTYAEMVRAYRGLRRHLIPQSGVKSTRGNVKA
jgi:G:T/U-mismatch repair DNA glycosylase